jgi:hypothetical protein
VASTPPDEPEHVYTWIDAEWLPDTWEPVEPIEPTRDVDRFRRTTAGAILAAGLLGIEKVLMPERSEQPPVTWEAPGEPPGPRHLEFDLDPDDPEGSTVTVRRWLPEAGSDGS